jgi:hypothetical protein
MCNPQFLVLSFFCWSCNGEHHTEKNRHGVAMKDIKAVTHEMMKDLKQIT